MEGEGLLLDLFRERKLLEAYVETVALKYDLSMQEIRLLLYLSQSPWEGTRKDLAEILDISRGALTMAVQKLSSRSLVWADGGQADEKKGGRSWRLTCMDEARRFWQIWPLPGEILSRPVPPELIRKNWRGIMPRRRRSGIISGAHCSERRKFSGNSEDPAGTLPAFQRPGVRGAVCGHPFGDHGAHGGLPGTLWGSGDLGAVGFHVE